MEKLRMAIIGSGQIAQVTHIPNYQSMEKVEIVGICDTRLEAARSVADKFHIAHYYGYHLCTEQISFFHNLRCSECWMSCVL